MTNLLNWLILTLWLYWLIFYWRGGTKIAADIQHSLDDIHWMTGHPNWIPLP